MPHHIDQTLRHLDVLRRMEFVISAGVTCEEGLSSQ